MVMHTIPSVAIDEMMFLDVKQVSTFCVELEFKTDKPKNHKLRVPYRGLTRFTNGLRSSWRIARAASVIYIANTNANTHEIWSLPP
jgi:hypothetical protein